MSILNAAAGDDLVILNNKIMVAEYFTEQYGQNGFDTQNYADLLEPITAQSFSVNTVKALIDSQVNLMIIAKIPQIAKDVLTTAIESNSNYINYFLLQTNKIRTVDLSVAYKTLDGTAKAGQDYIASSGRATIKAGQLQTAIPITIMGDYIAENEEYYYLQISDPQGAEFNTGITEIITKRTIIDDD